MSLDWPDQGPEIEVWNHIHTGVDLAEQELDVLPEPLRTITESVGKALVELRSDLVAESAKEELVEADEDLLANPWIRYAADLHIATEALIRAVHALERYLDIKPVAAAERLPENAQTYVREATRTFIFGFDAACIALCRAALEQMLKERLVSSAALTAGQLRRNKHSAGSALENAKRAKLISGTYRAAKAVIERGDTVMHSHIYDKKILRQLAADSVRDLAAALTELMTAV